MIEIIQKKERITWIIALIVVLAITILIVSSYHMKITALAQKVEKFESNQNTWSQQQAELTAEIADLKARVENESKSIQSLPFNKAGSQDIINDLMKHDELIPYEGVLGGKMNFYSEKDIFVLSDKWVLAYFEDGHIGGNMLLEYSIKDDKISWKVIDSYVFQ